MNAAGPEELAVRRTEAPRNRTGRPRSRDVRLSAFTILTNMSTLVRPTVGPRWMSGEEHSGLFMEVRPMHGGLLPQ